MGNDVVRLCLKVWNWAMGVGGVVTITYAILMFRVSQSWSSSQHITLLPWYVIILKSRSVLQASHVN